MTWVNQPRHWRRDGRDLAVRTEPFSEFWRTTALGYERDSGHAFLAREQGDVVAEVSVRAAWSQDQDEAGLMVRLNDRLWASASVRLMDGKLVAAVVSTRDASDLSVCPLPGAALDDPVRVRLERVGNAVRAMFSVEGEQFQVHRLAHFPAGIPVGIGPMCCSPRHGGLDVDFTACEIGAGRPSWAWLI